MKNWYHCILGQVKGPFSLSQIEDKIKQEEMSPDDLIYKFGEKEWTLVKDRWQFQKAILEKKITNKEMPKQDWVVLKQEDTKSITNKDFSPFQYNYYSTQEILKNLHNGRISYSDWIWKEGMKNWKCIRDLSLFKTKADNNKNDTDKRPLDLGDLTDSELRQSIIKAKPASSLISSVIDTEEKPNEAQGPNLVQQFGNLKFPQAHSYKKSHIKTHKAYSKSSVNQTIQARTSDHLMFSLNHSNVKNLSRQNISRKRFFTIISISFLIITIFVILSTIGPANSKKSHKNNDGISLQYKVLHYGLELHFWIRDYAKKTIRLKIKNEKQQSLTANDFEQDIKIQLDKDGQAVLRLDHFNLVEGYYRFSGYLGKTSFFNHKFFVGHDEHKFAHKLSEFHKLRQYEKRKVENIKKRKITSVVLKKKQRIPKSMKNLYGQVRQLEKGYHKYSQNLTEWQAFYSSWENSFNNFQSNALGYVKQRLDLDLMEELQTIEQDLKIMGEHMDQSVKKSNIKGFAPLSPQVAVFLEKVKNFKVSN